MSKYQYPALTDEKEFELLINDLCKKEFNLNTFQLFGRKGQKQDGIDGITLNSQKNLIVHQCKNKLLNREDKKIQVELITDLENEVISARTKFIDTEGYDIEYFIFANSFKQDTKVQEKAIELSKSYGFNIIVWSWDEIQDMLDRYLEISKQYYPHFFDKNILSCNEIQKRFKLNSSILASSSNFFIEKSFIDVSEYSLIEDFMYKKNDNNLLILTGKAGIGKTAVLSKIQDNLEEKELTFLSIKSDRVTIENKQSLSSFFEVDNLLHSIKQVSLYDPVIILIDQLDALSLTLSSDRSVINIILEFIAQVKRIPNVNIIVSLREYDLKNDPMLSYLDNDNVVYLKPFSEEYIKQKIKRLVTQNNKLSNSLIELLRVPLHLSLFLELYENDSDCLSIKTIQDLYKKFWEQKVLDKTIEKVLKDNSINLINKIVSKMDSLKKIQVPILYFQDEYSDEISLLLSKGIIVQENERLAFFHQTFYDFLFARSFVKNEKSLYQYVTSIEQTLEVREQIKQIIEFLRGSNEEEVYLEQIKQFLKSSDIRLHIKLLIIAYLGNIDNPTEDEFSLLLSLFKSNSKYEQYFIESWISSDWVDYFVKIDFFNKDNFKKYNLHYKLETFVNKIPNKVLKVLDDYEEDKDIKEESIISCLSRLDIWNDNALSILKKYRKVFINKKNYRYEMDSIFNKLYNYDTGFAEKLFIELLNNSLKDVINLEKQEIIEHETVDAFKEILTKDSKELYIGILSFFENISKEQTKKNSKKEYIIEDDIFDSSSMFQFESTLYTIWDLYRQVLERLSIIAQKDKKLFNEILQSFNSSKYMSIINFKIFAYFQDVVNYKDKVFDLLTDKELLEEVSFDCENGFKLMKMISKSYNLYDYKQKQIIFNTLSSILPSWEKRRWRKESSLYGFTKYKLLLQLPTEEIKKFDYYKELLELQRKFPWYIESEPRVSKGSCVGSPLTENVYKKMTLKNWLQSILVFDKVNKRTNSFLRGDKLEHSRVFEEQVKKNHDKFYNFLFEIKDKKVHVDYLSAGLSALIESEIDSSRLLKIIKYYSNIGDSWLQRQILKGIKKLLNNKIFESSVLDILENSKNIKYESIVREKDKFQTIHEHRSNSINSFEGDFVALLPLIFKTVYKDKAYETRVLKMINEVIENNVDFVMFEFVDKLSYIHDIDKHLYSDLICKIIDKDELGQLSLYTLNKYHYLYQNSLINKSILINIIKRCITFISFCKKKEDSHYISNLGMVLFFYFLNNELSESLLEKAISSNKQVVDGILSQIFNREIKSVNVEIIEISKKYILKFKNDEENDSSYRYNLNKLNNLKFIEKDFKFVQNLAKSMNIKRESNSFVEYLRNEYYENSKIVDKVLLLLESNIQSLIYKTKEDTYYFDNKELIEFIIELYNRMKLKNEREKVLDLLDSFLENDNLRFSTKNLIE